MRIANRLAFSTLGCPEWNLERTVENGTFYGFSAIEIRGLGTELQTSRIPAFLPENRQKTVAYLSENGLPIICIGTSCSFHDPSGFGDALKEGRETISLCKDVGIPYLRVFGDRIPEESMKGEIVERAAEGIGELCSYAQVCGNIQVLLEIHGDFNTIDVIAPLLEKIGKLPAFGILWDIEHSYRAYGADCGEFYRLIRPYIRHTHIKDCRIVDGNAESCLLGEGELPIAELISMLEEDGYRGMYSFEWEKRWQPEIEGPEIAFPRYVRQMKLLEETL